MLLTCIVCLDLKSDLDNYHLNQKKVKKKSFKEKVIDHMLICNKGKGKGSTLISILLGQTYTLHNPTTCRLTGKLR